MNCRTMDELVTELKRILKFRDIIVSNKDDDILKYELNRAIQEINKGRRFVPSEDKPYDPKYDSLIIPLCVTAFSKIGAEGQSSHSENGVTRNYTCGGDYPIDMLDGVIPLVK